MKTKKFSKKLRFNKETILNLDNGKMKAVQGGGLYTDDDPTCPITICATNCPWITKCWSNPCC